MVEVKFYDTVNDELLKFAVIISQSNGKWVFCKHKERNTWEVPGGHREDGEDILETAKRELYEETGAITFDITPICIYSVTAPDNFDGMETFGKLFFSDIYTFEKELHSEIEKIAIMDELPINWTYPEIQPKLLEEARKRGFLPKKEEIKWLFFDVGSTLVDESKVYEDRMKRIADDVKDNRMDNIVECAYNMDNGYVEVWFTDGNMLRIKCEEVETALRTTEQSLAKLHKLLDNKPIEYVAMVLSGEMQAYCDIDDDMVKGMFGTIVQGYLKKGYNRATAEMMAREFFRYES